MQGNRYFQPAALAFTTVVAVVFFFAGYSVKNNGPLPALAAPAPVDSRDGNPVGHDLIGKAILTSTSTKANPCLVTANTTCDMEVHYVAKKWPLPVAKQMTCPTSPSEYCLKFVSPPRGYMQLRTVDEQGYHHPGPNAAAYEKMDVSGTIVVHP